MDRSTGDGRRATYDRDLGPEPVGHVTPRRPEAPALEIRSRGSRSEVILKDGTSIPVSHRKGATVHFRIWAGE